MRQAGRPSYIVEPQPIVMTLRPNHRALLQPPVFRGMALVALAACAAAIGCSEEPKFEARRTHGTSRTAARRDSPPDAPVEVASFDDVEPTSNEPDADGRRARGCAPDAVLTGGEVFAPMSPTLHWPTTNGAATATQKPIEPQTTTIDSARPAPSSSQNTKFTAAAPNTDNRSIVTLAELETHVPKQASKPSATTAFSTESAPLIDATVGDAAALIRQAEEHNRRGLTTASKGAVFSARKEFHAALRDVAAALDATEQSQRHRTALTSGLSALTEMNDFASLEKSGEGSGDVAAVIAGHASQVVPVEAAVAMTSAALRERYMAFAIERLSFAAALPTGSVALHRLGKVSLSDSSTKSSESRTKARVFLEAALQVDANNFPAANDLAVFLAEEGRYDQAVTLLRDGLRRSPQPALWTNLAAIHDLRGESQLAEAARLEARAAASRGSAGVLPAYNVAWVDTRTFAATSQPNTEMQAAVKTQPVEAATKTVATNAGSASRSAAPRTSTSPGPTARQPFSTALTPRRNAMVQ